MQIMHGRRGWRDGGTERRRVRGRIGWYLSVAPLLLLSVDGGRSPPYGLVQTAITDRGFGPVTGGGELGGVEGGLVEFGGELFVSKGLGGQIAVLGQYFGELQLVHVDSPGQAEEARGDAVAVDGAAFGTDFVLLTGIIDGPANRALGELGEAFHFMGNAEATGQDQLVALVGEPALGAEPLVRIEAAVFTGFGMRLPALDAVDDAGDGGLIDAEEGADVRLGFALHVGELVDEELVAGGLIGWMLASGGHGGLLVELVSDVYRMSLYSGR